MKIPKQTPQTSQFWWCQLVAKAENRHVETFVARRFKDHWVSHHGIHQDTEIIALEQVQPYEKEDRVGHVRTDLQIVIEHLNKAHEYYGQRETALAYGETMLALARAERALQ